MADDIGLGQSDHSDALDAADPFHSVVQAAGTSGREVVLRGISGDHDPGIAAHPGQEHFHLGDGRVLAFIQNDHGVVQGSASHIGERGDFNQVACHISANLFEVHQIIEGVQQRPEIRIDFGFEIAWEEPKMFAGFDGGPDQNDFLDASGSQSTHSHGHGQKCFSGTGWAKGKNELVVLEGFEVSGLTFGTGPDNLAAFANFERRWGR